MGPAKEITEVKTVRTHRIRGSLWHPERLEVEIAWANYPTSRAARESGQTYIPAQDVRVCRWILIGDLRPAFSHQHQHGAVIFSCQGAFPLDQIEAVGESAEKELTRALTQAARSQLEPRDIDVAPIRPKALDLSETVLYRQREQARLVKYLQAQPYRYLRSRAANKLARVLGSTGPEVTQALHYIRKQEEYLKEMADGNESGKRNGLQQGRERQ